MKRRFFSLSLMSNWQFFSFLALKKSCVNNKKITCFISFSINNKSHLITVSISGIQDYNLVDLLLQKKLQHSSSFWNLRIGLKLNLLWMDLSEKGDKVYLLISASRVIVLEIWAKIGASYFNKFEFKIMICWVIVVVFLSFCFSSGKLNHACIQHFPILFLY